MPITFPLCFTYNISQTFQHLYYIFAGNDSTQTFAGQDAVYSKKGNFYAQTES